MTSGCTVSSRSSERSLALVSSATRPLVAPRVSDTSSSSTLPMLPQLSRPRRVHSLMAVKPMSTSPLPVTIPHQRNVLKAVLNNMATTRTLLLTPSSLATFPLMLMRTLLVRLSVLTALLSMSDFLLICEYSFLEILSHHTDNFTGRLATPRVSDMLLLALLMMPRQPTRP